MCAKTEGEGSVCVSGVREREGRRRAVRVFEQSFAHDGGAGECST